jgi:hypothetical protein
MSATFATVCLLALTPCMAEQFSNRRVSVRGVQPDLWDWLYVESARSRVPLGVLLNVLITDWQAHTDEQRHAALERWRRHKTDQFS